MKLNAKEQSNNLSKVLALKFNRDGNTSKQVSSGTFSLGHDRSIVTLGSTGSNASSPPYPSRFNTPEDNRSSGALQPKWSANMSPFPPGRGKKPTFPPDPKRHNRKVSLEVTPASRTELSSPGEVILVFLFSIISNGRRAR